jgi:hypothetical protein
MISRTKALWFGLALLAIGLFLGHVTLAKASRNVGSFSSVNVVVEGTDTLCTSFTSTIVSGTLTITCNVGSTPPPPGAPTGCVAKLNNNVVSAVYPSSGGQSTLSVTCASPSVGLSYSWKRNSTAGVNTNASWTDNYGANASTTTDVVNTYQVTVCVSLSCVTVPSTPIAAVISHTSVQAWNGTCPGFASTLVIDVDWSPPSTRQYTASHGGFGPADIMVVRFKTGSVSSGLSLPRIAAAEYQSSPSSRIAAISDTPCSFSPLQGSLGSYGEGNTVTMVFATGTGTGFGYYPALELNKTYYVNVKNSSNSTCQISGDCNLFIDFIKPAGL